MPSDPYEIDRAHERLAQLRTLRLVAAARAAHPPRIGPESWRGPAYDAYLAAAEQLADGLRSLATELERAELAARRELARALA